MVYFSYKFTYKVLFRFPCILSFKSRYNIYLKRVPEGVMLRGVSLVHLFFLRLLLAGGGIIMDLERGGRHFHGSSSLSGSGMGVEIGNSLFFKLLTEGHDSSAL